MRTRAQRRGGRGLVALVVVGAVVGALLAGCSSSDDGAKAKASRGATKQASSGGWDVDLHVRFTNWTARPIEFGAFPESSADATRYILSASPAGTHTTSEANVIPAATNSGKTAGAVDLLIQAKALDDEDRVTHNLVYPPSDPYAGQHFRISLPTMQIRIAVVYIWVKEAGCPRDTVCKYERRAQVQVTTLNKDGDPQAPKDVVSCLDPTTFPKWDTQVGLSSELTTARWADRRQLDSGDDTTPFDGFDIAFENPSKIDARSCASKEYLPHYTLPGFSLGAGSGTEAGDGLQLTGLKMKDPSMPGVDLSGAQLSNSSFVGDDHANFSYATFDHADLTKADFAEANLTGATFVGTDVTGLRLKDATLFGVDLSKTTGDLGDITGIRMCHTKLPQSLVDELGPDYQPDADCQKPLQGGVGSQPGYDGALVDTGSWHPLILTRTGKVGCRAQSAAGTNQGARLPDCTVSYGSSLLPGGQGAITDYIGSNGSVRTGWGSLDLRLDAIYGWDHAYCLKAQGSVAEACPDRYRPPPA